MTSTIIPRGVSEVVLRTARVGALTLVRSPRRSSRSSNPTEDNSMTPPTLPGPVTSRRWASSKHAAALLALRHR